MVLIMKISEGCSPIYNTLNRCLSPVRKGVQQLWHIVSSIFQGFTNCFNQVYKSLNSYFWTSRPLKLAELKTLLKLEKNSDNQPIELNDEFFQKGNLEVHLKILQTSYSQLNIKVCPSRYRLTGKELEMIVDIWSKNISTLNLQQLEVTDQDLAYIAKHCPNLELIVLDSCTEITDTGIKNFLNEMPQLIGISLVCSPSVTYETVCHILNTCKQLISLDVCSCPKLAGRGEEIGVLKKSYTDVEQLLYSS